MVSGFPKTDEWASTKGVEVSRASRWLCKQNLESGVCAAKWNDLQSRVGSSGLLYSAILHSSWLEPTSVYFTTTFYVEE